MQTIAGPNRRSCCYVLFAATHRPYTDGSPMALSQRPGPAASATSASPHFPESSTEKRGDALANCFPSGSMYRPTARVKRMESAHSPCAAPPELYVFHPSRDASTNYRYHSGVSVNEMREIAHVVSCENKSVGIVSRIKLCRPLLVGDGVCSYSRGGKTWVIVMQASAFLATWDEPSHRRAVHARRYRQRRRVRAERCGVKYNTEIECRRCKSPEPCFA